MSDEPRTYVVTGTASGIGRAVKSLLTDRGNHVIGLDVRDADLLADLSTPDGRRGAVASVADALQDRPLDALIACAGLRHASADTVSVNFFGTSELAAGLRPFLARSATPRVVLTSSIASYTPCDEAIVQACLADDEPRAREAAETSTPDPSGRPRVYSSSKTAVSRWLRTVAAASEWGSAGILMNAVAPGVVNTPMTADMRESEESRRRTLTAMPNAQNRFAEPEEIAEVFAWLASVHNRLVVGQTLYADLGSEVLMRGVGSGD